MSISDSADKMDLLAKSLNERAMVCSDTDTSESGERQALKSLVTSVAEGPDPLDIDSIDAPEFRVLANPLLFEKIAQHLNHSDLKALSETGKLLQGLTRRCSIFANMTQLNILNRDAGTKNLDLLESDIIAWKNVKLHVQNWEREDYLTLQSVVSMPSVETLELEQEVNENSFYEVDAVQIPRNAEQVSLSLNQCITQLITSPPNLRSLKLNVELLSRVGKLFDSPQVEQCLSSLHTLEISVPDKLAQSRVLTDFRARVGDRYRNFTKNITSLARIVPKMKLRSFTFQLNIDHEGKRGLDVPYVAALLQILARNRTTLEELSLHGHVWSCKEMGKIQCPSLQTLDAKTRTKSSNSSNVAAFIEQQPFLRSLTLQISGEIVRKPDLPDVIRRKSSKLQRLHVSWTLTTDPNAINWTFLEELPHLKDVSICQHQSVWNSGEGSPLVQLLTHLPPALDKLQIYTHVRVPRSRPQIDGLSILISSLAKLKNLKVLDLMNGVPDTMSDTALQFICRSLDQLQVLRLNRSAALTDFGVTGKQNGEETGVSIANLKRLQKLEIRSCEGINFSSLVSVIRFKDLKHLHLRVSMNWDDAHARAISKQILRIAIQNPGLEQFKIGNCYPRKSHPFSKEAIQASIQKFLPRFKELRLYAGSYWPLGTTEAEYEEEVSSLLNFVNM